MSPEKDPNVWIAISGGLGAAWLTLHTFVLRGFGRDISEVKKSAGVHCTVGIDLNGRLVRLERKVPSGDMACASGEDVNLLFEKVDDSTKKMNDLTQEVTKFITIVKERLPKS